MYFQTKMKATILSAIAVVLLIQAAHGTRFTVPPELSERLDQERRMMSSLRALGLGSLRALGIGWDDGMMLCGTQCSYMAGVLTCTGECTQPELDAIKDYYENKQSKDTKSSTVQSGLP